MQHKVEMERIKGETTLQRLADCNTSNKRLSARCQKLEMENMRVRDKYMSGTVAGQVDLELEKMMNEKNTQAIQLIKLQEDYRALQEKSKRQQDTILRLQEIKVWIVICESVYMYIHSLWKVTHML